MGQITIDGKECEFEQGQDFSITLFYQGPDTNTNEGLITKGYADDSRATTMILRLSCRQ